MHLKVFEQKTANLFGENRLLKVAVVAMAATMFFQYRMLQEIRDRQVTVLVPPGMTTPLTVSGSDASDEYLQAIATYLTSLAGTYTAATARAQFDELLRLYTPEAYNSARVALYDLADRIEQSGRLTSAFTLQSMQRQADELIIRGLKTRFAERTIQSQTRVEYAIRFAIRHSRFWIVAMNQKELQ